jgi:hypothetical protein
MTQSETLRQLKKSIDDVFRTKASLETFTQEMSQRCPGVPLRRCFDLAVPVIQDMSPPGGALGMGQQYVSSFGDLPQVEREEARRYYEENLTQVGEKFPEIKKKFSKQLA